MSTTLDKVRAARAASPSALSRRADRSSLAYVLAVAAMPTEQAQTHVRQHRARLAELALADLDPDLIARVAAGVIAAIADLSERHRAAAADLGARILRQLSAIGVTS